MDDFDEDIILPSSPISEYIGNENVHFEEYAENESFKQSQLGRSYCLSVFKSLLTNIFTSAKFYLSELRNLFVPSFIHIELYQLKRMHSHLKHAKILTSEDEIFLKHYEMENNNSEIFQSPVYRHIITFLIFLLLFTSKIYLDPLYYVFLHDGYFGISTCQYFFRLIFNFLTFIYFLLTLFNFLEFMLYCIVYSYLSQSIYFIESLISTIRKCIRLIQEAELVARGFTSASVISVAERLELSTNLPIVSPKRQYPELRKNILKWQKQIFMCFRNSTLMFIEHKRFGPQLDFSEYSLATFHLKEFGGLLNYNVSQENEFEELLAVTDNLSVAALKTMNHLMDIQISECYKYIYLNIALSLKDSLHFSFERFWHFYWCCSPIKCICSEATSLKNDIFDIYQFYNILEISKNNETIPLHSPDKFSLENVVHNMILHIKAALSKLISVEEYIKIYKISNDSSKDNLKNVEILLKAVKSELDVYSESFHEFSAVLQDLLHGEKKSEPNLVVCNPLENINYQKNIPKCDSELEIEDEVYEGIIPQFSVKTENVIKENFDTVKQLQAKEVNSLIYELKNVLVLKADEHRARELKALAKKMPKALCSKGSNAEFEVLQTDVNVQSEANDSEGNNSFSGQNFSLKSDNAFDKETVTDQQTVDEYMRFQTGIKESNEEISNVNTKFCPGKNISIKGNSFAASIAALAAQRQQMGGSAELSYGDPSSSDEELG